MWGSMGLVVGCCSAIGVALVCTCWNVWNCVGLYIDITSMGEGIMTYVWDVEDDMFFVTLLQQLIELDVSSSVVSMSYGDDETSSGEAYCNRANTEFIKVGLAGVTFFASSGDEYLHRVGRAGRFSTKGLAITFVSSPSEAEILEKVQERFKVKVTVLPNEIETSSYSLVILFF